MVVEGMCLLVVLIGRLGRRGTGLVGELNEVPAAVEHKFGPPAVQCESQAHPDLLEEDGLARSVVDVEELEMLIGEWRLYLRRILKSRGQGGGGTALQAERQRQPEPSRGKGDLDPGHGKICSCGDLDGGGFADLGAPGAARRGVSDVGLSLVANKR